MSAKFIGNIKDWFDCNELISQCLVYQGETHNGHLPLDPNNIKYDSYLMQVKAAEDAGYHTNSAIEFRHFKPGKHFDVKFVELFSDYVKATPIVIFVSEIKPGRMAPWHYDIDPFEEENSKKGEIVRFHLHLSEPKPGHIFILEDTAFYNIPQGNVYQWGDINAWHAGSNCGMVPKYLFNFKGYR